MNPFYDKFPDSVEVQGRAYRVYTDFRCYLFMLDILESDITDQKKAEAVLWIYEDEIPKDHEAAMLAVADFIAGNEENIDGGQEPDGEKPKKLLSYEKDAPFIISDFLRFYQIDLVSCTYLHWQKFRLLLEGLPEESETKKRVAYRDIDAGKIKDKNERERILAIQRRIAIEGMEADEYRIGELFGGLM